MLCGPAPSLSCTSLPDTSLPVSPLPSSLSLYLLLGLYSFNFSASVPWLLPLSSCQLLFSATPATSVRPSVTLGHKPGTHSPESALSFSSTNDVRSAAVLAAVLFGGFSFLYPSAQPLADLSLGAISSYTEHSRQSCV